MDRRRWNGSEDDDPRIALIVMAVVLIVGIIVLAWPRAPRNGDEPRPAAPIERLAPPEGPAAESEPAPAAPPSAPERESPRPVG